jgi:hypothetical protein
MLLVGVVSLDYLATPDPALVVALTGRIGAASLTANPAEQDIPALERFRRGHRKLRGVFLVHDGGASNVAGDTIDDLAGRGGSRLLPEPCGVTQPRLRQA